MIVFGITLVTSFVIGIVLIFNTHMQLKTSHIFFNMMLERIVQAPINLYFDITPIGRILNNFGTDLAVVEGGLYQHIQEFAIVIVNTLFVVVIVVLVVP